MKKDTGKVFGPLTRHVQSPASPAGGGERVVGETGNAGEEKRDVIRRRRRQAARHEDRLCARVSVCLMVTMNGKNVRKAGRE